MIHYDFKNESYISSKDITIGFTIGSEKRIVYGIYGRVWYVKIDLLFIHIIFGLLRTGNEKKIKNDKK